MEAEIWSFQVAHQGYLHLRVDRPSQNQIASGARAIGVCNTVKMFIISIRAMHKLGFANAKAVEYANNTIHSINKFKTYHDRI